MEKVNKLDSVVAAVCMMPLDFHERGNVSMLQLCHESGYLQEREAITEALLAEYIRQHPELIETWLNYSADQRCSPSWGFCALRHETSAGKHWEVAYYPDGEARLFQDGAEACAFFIKQYMETLARIAQRSLRAPLSALWGRIMGDKDNQ